MFLHFVKAVTKHWWALMSCAVFTIIGIVAAASNRSNSWIVWVSGAAAVILLLVASFLAWRDKYTDLQNALITIQIERDKSLQPDLALRWELLPEEIHFGTFQQSEKHILVHNRSEEYVYNVQIAPVSLGNGLAFDLIPEIPPGVQEIVVGRWGDHSSLTTNYICFFEGTETEAAEKNLYVKKPHNRGISDSWFKIPLSVTYDCHGVKWQSSFEFTYDPGSQSHFEKKSENRL